MLKATSPDAGPGDLVHVYDKEGQPFGAGLYNPKARVPLRVLFHGDRAWGETDLEVLLRRALDLRLQILRLPETTDAFRVVHSDGDGLSGLVLDRYNDVLRIEVHSLGIHQRLDRWLPLLHQALGTRHATVSVDPDLARIERIRLPRKSAESIPTVRIRENGVRFEVNFVAGHKTGFFCDQRDNRRGFARLVAGLNVLDLCCYTGGFSLAAKILGQAGHVTGVDLDEEAIAQARRNANLNQTRADWVHCDAFSYARQMQRNRQDWDAIILDPPKLVLSRDDAEEGERKYQDLNQLALMLVKPGGLFVTCSCSGLLHSSAFEAIVTRAAHRARRRLQIFDRTGAASDHPVMSNCPESQYLKVLWARVF